MSNSDTLIRPKRHRAPDRAEFERLIAELKKGPIKPPPMPSPAQQISSLSASVERHLETYFDAHVGTLPPSGLYDRILTEVERPLIELSLEACRYNQIKAAALLGLNRNTLRKKMKLLGIPAKGEGR